MEFKPFPKLARLNREIVITEKIDGTNAQVYIKEDCTCRFWRENTTEYSLAGCTDCPDKKLVIAERDGLVMYAGSRTKWITPGKQTDNAGFATWVKDNADALWALGPGQHFGEWWGEKIQRGYGLKEKRFSLFNTGRWVERYAELSAVHDEGMSLLQEGQQMAPACCHVVPVLYQGPFDLGVVSMTTRMLVHEGSKAAPGFMKPEGIVIYHTAANLQFKVTLEGDESPKSLLRAA